MSESPKRTLDSTIIAAVIGGIVTIAVTVITVYGNRPATPTPYPTWTPPPTSTITDTPKPTDTVPAGEPTSTPAPDTPTPLPTDTPAPPIVGEDWANGCISGLWSPFPVTEVTQVDGCLSEPVNTFFAEDGKLSFIYNGKVSSQEIYGFFTQLPGSGTVSLEASLNELTNGEIWMGIFSQKDINSTGMLLAIPPGNVKKRLFVQKIMPGQVKKDTTQDIPANPPVYAVVFDFNTGSVKASIPVIQYNFNSVPVVSAEKWLFVGYRLVSGTNQLDAGFQKLVIKAQ